MMDGSELWRTSASYGGDFSTSPDVQPCWSRGSWESNVHFITQPRRALRSLTNDPAYDLHTLGGNHALPY